MRELSIVLTLATLSLSCAAQGNGQNEPSVPSTSGEASVDASPPPPIELLDGASVDAAVPSCPPCVVDTDCHGGVCAQFGGDTYCAPLCSPSVTCAADRACTSVSTASGDQKSVCIPRGDVCGANPGPGPIDAGAPPGNQTCGTLVPPSTSAQCKSCGTQTCQPNGCYGGWYCDSATNKCHSPPTNCQGAPTDAGTGNPQGDSGTGNPQIDAGGPVSGQIGPSGGAVSRLVFAIVGDTRPAVIDDTTAYPSSIIQQIYGDIEVAQPRPSFVVSSGDYVFASTTGGQSSPQLDAYVAARSKYSGVLFPAMGNHECTGATASNCGAGATNGTTRNMTDFIAKLLAPINQTEPYYSIAVAAIDQSWTAKLVFVAGNAWSATQATWLQSALARPTTYTFIIRHEPKAASTAPGVSPSEQIMAQYPYTLAIVGHTHTYGKTGPKQVTIGNGGAPLTGSANYGYGLVTQRADGAVQVDMIDYQTQLPDTAFRFALNADGTAAP